MPALEALIRRRHVTRAAEDVGLSQPAMSRALRRLREALDDPRWVRVGAGLAPTPRARALLPELVDALDRLSGVYRAPAFEPARLDRAFGIVGADIHTVLIAPPLVKRVRAEAPGVDLRFEAYSAELRERLESGAVDLAFAVATTQARIGFCVPVSMVGMYLNWKPHVKSKVSKSNDEFVDPPL